MVSSDSMDSYTSFTSVLTQRHSPPVKEQMLSLDRGQWVETVSFLLFSIS